MLTMNRTISPIDSRSRRRCWHTWSRTLSASMLAVACAGGGADGEAQQLANVAFVAVLPGSATLPIGDSIPLTAVVIDGRGDTLRGPVVRWQSANSAIATVTASGMVWAVAPGLAGITAESGGRTGSARVIVIPGGLLKQDVPRATPHPPASAPANTSQARPPSAGQGIGARPATAPTRDPGVPRRGADSVHPNEPDGFRPLADRGFLTKAKRDNDRGDGNCDGGSECWDGVEYRYPNFTIVEDGTAPHSCCTIARMRYQAGHRSGTAPATVQTLAFKPPVEQIYVSIWARISENWFGNQSGTNKMFFLGIRSANTIFLSAEGSGNGPLEPQIRLQGIPDERRRLRPNVRQVRLTRGKWQHWEFHFKLNDPGAPNGTARMWIDGQPVTEVHDILFRARDAPSLKWWIFHWSPTYGGGGASPGVEQYLDFDHVYVSGR